MYTIGIAYSFELTKACTNQIKSLKRKVKNHNSKFKAISVCCILYIALQVAFG
ncbi:unnamed protein product, partial [marine sediment metagenome]